MEPKQPEKDKKKKRKTCKYFKRGFCKNRNGCRFLHTLENCEDWILKEGSCINQHCQKRHIPTCIYHNIGKCRFGSKCHYIHKTTKQNDLQKELDHVKEDNNILKQSIRSLTEELQSLKVMMSQKEEKKVEEFQDALEEVVDDTKLKKDMKNIIKEEVADVMEGELRYMKENVKNIMKDVVTTIIDENTVFIKEKTKEIEDSGTKTEEKSKKFAADVEDLLKEKIEKNTQRNEDNTKKIEARMTKNEEETANIRGRLDTLIHRIFS